MANQADLAQRLIAIARAENRLRVTDGVAYVRKDDGTWVPIVQQGAAVLSQQTVRDRKYAPRPTATRQIATLVSKAIGTGDYPDSYEYWLQLGRSQVKITTIPATLPVCPTNDPDDDPNHSSDSQPDLYPDLVNARVYACYDNGTGTTGGLPYVARSSYGNLFRQVVDGSHFVTPAGYNRAAAGVPVPESLNPERGFGGSQVYKLNVPCPVKFVGDLGETYFVLPAPFKTFPKFLSATTEATIFYEDPNGWVLSSLFYYSHMEQGQIYPRYPQPGWEHAFDGDIRLLYIAFKRQDDATLPSATRYQNFASAPCDSTPAFFQWSLVWHYEKPPKKAKPSTPTDPLADPKLPPGKRANVAVSTLSAYRRTIFVTIRDHLTCPDSDGKRQYTRLQCFSVGADKKPVVSQKPDENDWRKSMIKLDPAAVTTTGSPCLDDLRYDNYTNVEGNRALTVTKILTPRQPTDPASLLDTDRALQFEVVTTRMTAVGSKCKLVNPAKTAVPGQGIGIRTGDRYVIGQVVYG